MLCEGESGEGGREGGDGKGAGGGGGVDGGVVEKGVWGVSVGSDGRGGGCWEEFGDRWELLWVADWLC